MTVGRLDWCSLLSVYPVPEPAQIVLDILQSGSLSGDRRLDRSNAFIHIVDPTDKKKERKTDCSCHEPKPNKCTPHMLLELGNGHGVTSIRGNGTAPR